MLACGGRMKRIAALTDRAPVPDALGRRVELEKALCAECSPTSAAVHAAGCLERWIRSLSSPPCLTTSAAERARGGYGAAIGPAGTSPADRSGKVRNLAK